MVNLENKAHPYYIKGLLVLNLVSHFYVVMTKVKAYFICWRQCKLREESWMLLTWCPLVLCPPAAPLYRRKKPQADTKGEEYLVPQPATSVSAVEQYGFNILFFPLCWIPSCLRTLPLKYISLSCRNIVLITTVSIFNDQCSCLRSQKKRGAKKALAVGQQRCESTSDAWRAKRRQDLGGAEAAACGSTAVEEDPAARPSCARWSGSKHTAAS